MRLIALILAALLAAVPAAAQTSVNVNARNRTAWEPVRNNVDTASLVTLDGAAAGTTNSTDQVNYSGRGGVFFVTLTVNGGTPTLVVTIQGRDTVSGNYYDILATPSLTTTGTTVYHVYPGMTAAANSVANQPLPRTWRVRAVVAGTAPLVTVRVGASLIH